MRLALRPHTVGRVADRYSHDHIHPVPTASHIITSQKQSRALVAGRNMTLQQLASCVSARPAHLAFLQHPGYIILYFPAHPCFSALQLPRFLLHLRAAAFPRLPGCRSVTKTDSFAVGLICRPCKLSPGVVRMASSLPPQPPTDPSLATEAPPRGGHHGA
jgi:hypothetical protein